jgi:hypothetical protein
LKQCAERISGCKKKKVEGSCGKVRVLNVEHNDVYSSKSNSTIIVSMIRRQMGHIALMTEYTDECQVLVEKLELKSRLEVNLRTILRLDL